MEDPFYSQDEASPYIRTPPATMQWWRHKGRGPAYVKIGRRVFYRRSALDAFVAAGEVQPEMA